MLVTSVTDLSHEFEKVAVVEGVEEHDVAQRLRALGYDLAPGFLYARPLPAEQLPAVFATYGTNPREAAEPV